MKEHATFATGVVVAIAAAIVVPAIWQGSPIAWAVTAVLLLVVVISIAMYLSKRRKEESATPDEDSTMSAAPSPITVELISAHDQSIAARNKVRSTINFYNPPPPAQSAPLKDTDISDS
jgi:uncharacterized membrane protein